MFASLKIPAFRLMATALLLVLPAACHAEDMKGVSVGDTAPDFKLMGIDGKHYSLQDAKGKVTVLEWTNPGCPFVQRHFKEGTMNTLQKKYPEVAWLEINSTHPDSSNYLTPEKYRKELTPYNVTVPVLYDTSGKTGKAYGARTTPHMFVIDASGKIVYMGAIDDDPGGRKETSQRTNYVDLALTALKEGKKVESASTKPYGCSVKYGD